MAQKFTLRIKDHLHCPDAKRLFNESHFTESAPRYDLATRMLSFGRDKVWKQLLLDCLPEMKAPLCLDIACGTGDITEKLALRYPEGKIIGLDLTQAMIDIARKRYGQENCSFIQGDMSALPLENESVDILTGGYAIRNAPELKVVRNEIMRVLRPGGTAAFLDFSKPTSRTAQTLQYATLKFWGSLCGLVLHGNTQVHGYISESLRDYPDRKCLQAEFTGNGFSIVKERRLFGGMLQITVLEKPLN